MRASILGFGVAMMLLAASPFRATGQELPVRQPSVPSDLSAVAAAEAEKPPLLPAPRTVDMPILVYHHIVPGHAQTPLFVTPDGFEQQLRFLKDNGYQTVSFDDLADCIEYGIPLPDRPVILSFDDGWQNQFQYAFPLLQKYGFTGTFYIVSGYVDGQNFMTLPQLKALVAAGNTIGSHSRSHPALPSIGSPQRLKEEIVGSKDWLEQHLGVPITTFAYPYGSYTPAVMALVKAAGYRTARTVDDGTHYTADNLEMLDALIFPAYVNHYRDKVELASSETRR